MIDIKLSNNTNGIRLKVGTEDKARQVIEALMGVDGLKRITISGFSEDQAPIKEPVQQVEYPEQPCLIVTEPPKAKTSKFTELESVPKQDLGKYTDLFADGMAYYEQEDGTIIICRGSAAKIHTTWKAVEYLPYPVPTKQIKHLAKGKQIAIRNFREWIEQGQPDIYNDPDADFKQILTNNTKPKAGGDYENTVGCYE